MHVKTLYCIRYGCIYSGETFTMQPKDRPISPRATAGAFSKIFFIWVYQLLWTGRKKTLDLDDIYQTLPGDLSKALGDRLESDWDEEVKAHRSTFQTNGSKNSTRPSLTRVLTKIFFRSFALKGILLALEEFFAKLQPIFLGLLLKFLKEKEDGIHTNNGYVSYLYASGIVLCTMYFVISHHPSIFSIYHLNMKVRISCSALVYRKALQLSQSALEQTTMGQLVNILSSDVSRCDFALTYLHYLWIGPIQLGLVILILWWYFEISSLTGLFFVVIFTCQSLMGNLFGKLRLKVVNLKDTRIRVTNEVIHGIRVIKLNAWQAFFSKTIARLRRDEIKTIGRTLMLRAVNLSLYYMSTKFAVFLILMTYVLLNNQLTSEKAFVAVALYQNVRQIMTTYFPLGISCLAEFLVSVKRIEDFLLMTNYELPSNSSTTVVDNDLEQISVSVLHEVSLQNVVAKWNPESNEAVLNNITFKVSEGELFAIIGSVGSGKSSVLEAILHELPITSGLLTVKGNIAYATQEPWIFKASIRDNIIFNKAYDHIWYQDVLEACALKKDLKSFPYGDKTEVGNNFLSGGQKARINLARAVYADADIYLLDDPLSAVDAEIGHHLFNKCICGILKYKICILVTNQVQFLTDVKEILHLSDGITLGQGTYSDLHKNDENFFHVLKNLGLAKDKKDNLKSAEPNIRLRTGSLGSISAIDSFDEEINENDSVSITEEDRSTGAVGIKIYWKYITAGSNFGTLAFLLLSNIVTQIIYTGSDYWLQIWVNAEVNSYQPSSQSQMKVYNFLETVFPGLDKKYQYVSFYSALIAALFILTVFRTFAFFRLCMRSSVALHLQLFNGILMAPMSFFEYNPVVGRILNRFTKDIGVIDEQLPRTLFNTFELSLQVIGVVILTGIINPYFLIPSFVMGILFFTVRNLYQKTARNLKRLEGVARCPVYSHLSTSISGLTTIRALKAQDKFTEEFEAHLDLHSSTYFLFIASARWLGIVVDWISILYIAIVTFGVLALNLDSATSGLSISAALSLTRLLQWGVRQSAEAENQMVSVERVLEYINIESEAPLESSKDKKPTRDWPTQGEIEMQNVSMRYGSELLFLKNINCHIHSMEKIGIVGRSGAGKTSFISAIFRLKEPCQGKILIDGINVLEIGLNDLRSKISIIPQDPMLFVGTLRQNFDPLEEYTDAEIWDVLKHVHLFDIVKEQSTGLDTMVTEGGSNISVGQRQLICMGRSILKRCNIVVMDEATANVDLETDALIQHTIRTKFLKSTVLTIAHRLHTVIDSDKIMVFDEGELKEFDEPYKLLQNQSGFFYRLVQETGPESAASLTNSAKLKADSKTAVNSDGDAPTINESKNISQDDT